MANELVDLKDIDGNIQVVSIPSGGTGGITASEARSNLGLGTISTLNSPLPIANGGTGLTASPSMLTNVGSTSAANVLAASPRPGITGTLAIGHGGTGATSAAAALTNLIAGATEYHYRTTTTSVSAYNNDYGAQRQYTVSGAGLVAITCSIWCDLTSDYGTFKAQIFVAGTERSKSQWRMDNAQTQIMGASASLICKVTDGQNITMNLGSSHNGTKTCDFTVVAIGCTLS